MATPDPQRQLQELRNAAERISSNLVDLEIDSGRRLLEGSRLEGESAARWAEASSALTELWRRHGLLEDLLKRADGLRGSRRSDQLRALLNDRSIILSTAEVPLAQRDLLGTAQAAQRCSPGELLLGMSAEFDQVKAVVTRIGDAWERLIPQLDAARGLLRDTSRLAEEVGEGGDELATASRALDSLSASVTMDPLSVSPGDVDAQIESLRATRQELESDAELRRGFETRILEARGDLERVRSAVAEGSAAREELRVKIALGADPPAVDGHSELEPELTAITELAQHGAWREARRLLDEWSARAGEAVQEARRSRDASRAPVDARNQFRALLDAYQVKAKRLGRLEDPVVAGLFRDAQKSLYTAPTDLGRAAQLLRSYQEALSGGHANRQVAS